MRLDDLRSDQIMEVDKQNMLDKITQFPAQCEKCWEEIQKLVLPSYYLIVNKVVILGMGGSGVSGRIIQDLGRTESKLPIFVWGDYGIPEFVDNKTLILAVSFSGNTEETIDSFVWAKERGAKIISITSGGELERLSQKFRLPIYKFVYPPPPRTGIGFLFTAVLGILKRLEIIDINKNDVISAFNVLRDVNEKFKPTSPIRHNIAKQMAEEIAGYIPIIWGSSFLSSVAYRIKSDLNENAKTAAYSEILPELDHNSILGLEFPEELAKKIYILILQSKYDHARVRARQDITSQILVKKNMPHKKLLVEPCPTPLAEILVNILFSEYLSFYLALLNDTDPTPNEEIDFLKERLKGK